VRTPNKKSVARDSDVFEISIFIAFTSGDVKEAPALSEFKYDDEVIRGNYVRTFTDNQEEMRAWY
jgi:hypothetical protein